MTFGPIGIEHSGLAFFGIRLTPSAVQTLYQAALSWFERFACQPQLMGTTYDKGRLIAFSRSAAKLKKNGFNDVLDFQIDCLPPGAKNELEGLVLHVIWDSLVETFGISIRTEVATPTRSALLSIGEEITTICRPEYGIGFRRDENLRPGMYILGMPQNLPKTVEGLREDFFIGGWQLWGTKCRVWQHGFLRDVYPWNFLNPIQLEMPVNGMALKTWIQQGADRGILSAFANDSVLWEVEESHIASVRAALTAARSIFDGSMYHRIYQESSDGRSVPKEEILRRLKDPRYVLETAPTPHLSADDVLRQVFGDAAAEDLRVLHIDKSGRQAEIREMPTEEIHRIQQDKKYQR